MKITAPTDLGQLETIDDLKRFISVFFDQASKSINNNLSFEDNFKVSIRDVTFSGASSNVAVDHNLGKAPLGYLVASKSAAITVFNGTSANSASTLNVQASGAGTVKLIIF